MRDDERLLDPGARSFDDAVVSSRRRAQEEADALMEGANRLIGKAIAALELGEETKARTLVERACGLPYDSYNEVHTGPWAAHMALFSEITDALEESEEGDAEWLDVALLLRDSCEGMARDRLDEVLQSIAYDGGGQVIEDGEVKRIHAVVVPARGVPEADLGLSEEPALSDQVDVAWSMTTTAYRYHRAYFHGDPIDDV